MDRPHQSSPSDPHRRLLRHTYQEGPGFLFLATRGGRPPGPRGPRGPRVACASASAACGPRSTEGIAAALALGVSRASLHPLAEPLRGGRHRGAPTATTRTGAGAPAGLGRAGGHRRAPADVLEQQAPGGRVHPAGHLPARATTPSTPSSPSWARRDPRSAASTVRPTSGAGPTSSGTSTSRAPSSCSAPGATTRRSGSSGSSTTTAATSSACASCPGRRAEPILDWLRRLLRAVRDPARGHERQRQRRSSSGCRVS